jgi:hypothetical protein
MMQHRGAKRIEVSYYSYIRFVRSGQLGLTASPTAGLLRHGSIELTQIFIFSVSTAMLVCSRIDREAYAQVLSYKFFLKAER